MRAKNEHKLMSEAYHRVLSEAQFEGAYVESSEVEPQPDLSQLEGSFQAKKDPSVKYRYRVSQGEDIPSLEKDPETNKHIVHAPPGNIILTGHVQNENHPDGEEWSQQPDKFKQKYTVVEGDDQSGVAQALAEDAVLMKPMSQDFIVNTAWGVPIKGNAGDLLTMYGPNDYGALDQGAFNMYYNKV